jgi:hypothetical protein
MPDRTDQLIDKNRVLLAAAAATRQQTRQIITRAAVNRIKSDELRGRACLTLAVFPANDPQSGAEPDSQ